MDVGFSNLETLKRLILAESMQSNKAFDNQIITLGVGIKNQFENFTNRNFARLVGAQEVFPADRCEFLVSRLPIEVVTLAEKKKCETDGFVAQCAEFIRIIDQANGIINTGDIDAGRHFEQIRFTYTGGFFWNTLEKGDPNYRAQLPAGAAALPNDLFFAWVNQCKHMWKNQDKLGLDLLNDGDIKSLRFPQDFAPTIEATLNSYKRYNLV